MVSVKGKSSIRVADDVPPPRHTGGVRNFKIYPDNENRKIGSFNKMKSVVQSGASLSTASDSKGGSKIMEKINGKNNDSGTLFVRRKALADVSNVRNISSKSMVRDGSKSIVSTGPVSKTVQPLLRKPSTVKMKDDANQKVGEFRSTKRDVKDLKKASLNDQRTTAKNHGRESVGNNARRNPSTSTSFVPTRKSLPVLKRMSQTTTSNSKGSDERTNKSNRMSEIPAKSLVTRKVASQMNVGRRHHLGNRASDGFIMTRGSFKVQTHMDSGALSRKSIRPTSKTAQKVLNANGSSRSIYLSSMRKPIVTAKALSKKKDEAKTSSSPENVLAVVSSEATQGEASSDGNGCTTNQKLDVNARKKSGRRRSYTSLLMSRSKLLGEQGEVLDQEKLQSIDDDCNQLEVAEYVDDIYQYYWILEAQNSSLENYMSIQTEITSQMRGILINWLVEVHLKFELMQETLYLMVTLLDQYLSQVQIEKNQMQLIGLTALLLASKYEDFWHPRVKDLIRISAEPYTTDEMLSMERKILKKLKFRLNEPTPYVFMLRFLKAAQSDSKLEHMAFYLIELCLVEYEALKYKPSLLCASAIYVARTTLQVTPPWTPLLARHARYEVSHLRDCAELILRFHKAARTAQLKVTYEKYLSPELSRVADIKPLNKLPF